MSYDLSIKSDWEHSQRTSRSNLEVFIAALPQVQRNGTQGFLLDKHPRRWMEIDLEIVDAAGNSIENRGESGTQINCVQLHIPYAFFDPKTLEIDYLPTATAIAKHLGWKLYDLQGNRPDEPIYPNEKPTGWLKVLVPLAAVFVLARIIMWLARSHREKSADR